MSVTALNSNADYPKYYDYAIQTASGTGVINVGDWLYYSGHFVLPGTAFTVANKASGAGIAIESNPQYDSFGNIVTATALQYGVAGVYRVSARSGAAAWTLGQPCYPSATGSGVAAPTGATGLGALWDQCAKAQVSTAKAGGTGAQISHGSGVAIIVGVKTGAAGSAELDILLQPPRPDYV